MKVRYCTRRTYLAELAPLLFPVGAKDGLMAILAGYFDDSGTHKESTFVVVSGGVASVQQWTKLSSEWESAIRPWNLSRGYFHMADFVSGFNDYTGWSETQKKQRLHQLIQIVCEHVRVLVGN